MFVGSSSSLGYNSGKTQDCCRNPTRDLLVDRSYLAARCGWTFHKLVAHVCGNFNAHSDTRLSAQVSVGGG